MPVKRCALRCRAFAAPLAFSAMSLLGSCSKAPEQPKAVDVAATAGSSTPVEQGHYLVQAANCISCHTAPGGAPFAGGQAFQTTYRFLGNIYSSNITPDRDTGLGAWTENDFIQAMRLGIAPHGRHLFPAFPYTSFTKLTDTDLKAIYAYLRTVPVVHARPPDNSFWFRQRWVMALWNGLFFKPGEFAPQATQSDVWNRGDYLVEALGHCGACHTPRNLLLAESTQAPLTGGIQVSEVESGKNRIWSAPNLTSAESGLAKWSAEDLRKYLKTGHSRRAGILGPMNEVIANSLRYLTDADLLAMVTFIKSAPANGDSPQQTLSVDAQAAGQALYDKHCEECHLSTGRGGFRKAPPVSNSAIVQARNAASLVNVILYGATPAADIPAAFDTWEEMPGFKNKMTDAEVALLANFLRATWGNRGGRVSANFVAAQR
jgi:mono/diheme cytochrome c family protein